MIKSNDDKLFSKLCFLFTCQSFRNGCVVIGTSGTKTMSLYIYSNLFYPPITFPALQGKKVRQMKIKLSDLHERNISKRKPKEKMNIDFRSSKNQTIQIGSIMTLIHTSLNWRFSTGNRKSKQQSNFSKMFFKLLQIPQIVLSSFVESNESILRLMLKLASCKPSR